MTKIEAIEWLSSLDSTLGNSEYSSLWGYHQALVEIIEMLKIDESASNKLVE